MLLMAVTAHTALSVKQGTVPILSALTRHIRIPILVDTKASYNAGSISPQMSSQSRMVAASTDGPTIT